ncbi:hypothetical protein niasHS_009206 [Heterodera schachtii]|uniref:Acyl-coenzyme A oxidase n=1 Tax=Heterodera schachtii TaxID=97005 RepID=A0ABD2IWP7_HETSC
MDPSRDNPDLTEERRKAKFDPEKLGNFFWQGQLKRRRQICDYVQSQGTELAPAQPVPFMTRMEKLEDVARLSVGMRKHAENVIDVGSPQEQFYFNSLICGYDGSPFHLHFIMALPAMINNCDEEQAAEWLPKLFNCEIIATYVQTEMGHGTNLKALETTATYDASRQEFVFNSPTITSTKWWPGNLGKTANFAVVMAQLYTNGKCYGAHPFWVQLRDIETHKPLPGITVGDIGPKFGIGSNDNGFLRFNNYRIPRMHMLMKHAKVLPSGEYVPPMHSKVGYTSMMYVRSVMGEIRPGAGEVKVLDYQTQQYRLFPQIARVYAIAFTGIYIMDMYKSVMANINAGDASLLSDLHSLGSGLKSVTSWQTSLGIEQCRMACGGHGYSEASGLPALYTMAVGGCTYEGENMVMLLQCARSLMKLAAELRSSDRTNQRDAKKCANPVTGYLYNVSPPQKCRISQESGPDAYLEAFEHVARRNVFRAYERLDQLRKRGRSAEEAWNESGVALTKASKAHTMNFMAKTFVERTKLMDDPASRAVLENFVSLFLSYELLHCAEPLLEDSFISAQQMEYVRLKMYDSMQRIRPNAVTVVDSFDFTDAELKSVLGRRDGNVYEHLLEWAQKSPINAHDVLPFHDKYLGNYMKECIFHFHFWRYGRWTEVIIDDRLPCRNDGQLLYSRPPTENVFWAILLEKAYAKMYGGYAVLSGGRVSDCFSDLTGGITEEWDLKSLDVAKRRDMELNHAYAIMEARELIVENRQSIVMLLRNPWGWANWNGQYSPNSAEWKDCRQATPGACGIS